jgi:hypothetical protein
MAERQAGDDHAAGKVRKLPTLRFSKPLEMKD